MPIVVGVVGAQTPLLATSTDGLITARVREQYAGVLLTAQVGAITGTELVGFVRLDPDGVERFVRSGQYARVSGGLAVAYDAEAPLGVPVSYSAWTYSGPLRTRVSTRATVTIPGIADPWRLWVKPVGRPGTPMLVDVREVGGIERPDRSVVLDVDDREDPVVLYRKRSLRRFPLAVRTGTQAEGRAFDAQLRRPGTFLLQGCSGLDLDGVWAHIGQAPEDTTLRNVGATDRWWSLSVVELERPAPGNEPLRRPGQSYREAVKRTYRNTPGTYRQALLA